MVALMATRTVIQLVDDVDGSDAAETIHLGLGRQSYEIELSAQNAQKLREQLEPWTAAARRLPGGRRR